MNVIDKAIDKIHQDGWRQLDWGGEGEPHCILGALNLAGATFGSEEGQLARDLIKQSITEHYPNAWSSPMAFNDQPETTKEDVLLVMKHASFAYDEQEAS